MPKQKPSTKYFRLVVPITEKEFTAIEKQARFTGFKNVHRWAALKIAPAIRETVEAK